jgi:hypothetical protein
VDENLNDQLIFLSCPISKVPNLVEWVPDEQLRGYIAQEPYNNRAQEARVEGVHRGK